MRQDAGPKEALPFSEYDTSLCNIFFIPPLVGPKKDATLQVAIPKPRTPLVKPYSAYIKPSPQDTHPFPPQLVYDSVHKPTLASKNKTKSNQKAHECQGLYELTRHPLQVQLSLADLELALRHEFAQVNPPTERLQSANVAHHRRAMLLVVSPLADHRHHLRHVPARTDRGHAAHAAEASWGEIPP